MIDLHKFFRKYYVSFTENTYLTDEMKKTLNTLDKAHLIFFKILSKSS